MEKQNDPIKNVKAVAFDYIFKALIGIVLFFVMDLHSDMKLVMRVIPVLQTEIENLKDKSLMERFRRIESVPPAKHEDFITFDSLNHK